ncbi:MAG: response regulator with CheY-like receiver domain and winged-helix DNA-binding domain [Parcubacteria group bacterium Gr01-1014_72]|nr:MAG: response regulator with CheY-like receiver domain and winged-helix DNA-binding domain [Parcubacteria group bacterium Gr01-1014_72]
MKIIVVDDDAHVREMLSLVLGTRGRVFVAAEDGEQGLARFREHPDANVLITDYEMPRMNGLSLIGEVRKNNQAVCIILLSAKMDCTLERRGKEIGANHCLDKKPDTVNVLRSLISQIEPEEVGAMRAGGGFRIRQKSIPLEQNTYESS